MAGRIPDSVLRQIEQRVSLVDVVGDYLTLKKQGRNYVGLCPFHHEKTPSFSVSPEKGLFYCFGCGAGGGLFQFVMRMENLDFPAAVQRLAQRAGIPLESLRPKSVQGSREKEILALASEFFVRCLRSERAGGEGREYLKKRGILEPTRERFALGYCPPGGELLAFLQSRRVSAAEAVRAGLLAPASGGKAYPRFGRRVVFPIRDLSGDVVGFGGRAVLDQQQPKYLNSPESLFFRKSEVLYGLFEARQAVRASDRVVVVEGYLDALQLVQAGVENVVATMGTAWTSAHAHLVRRFVPECVILFDGDQAGYRAAERAFWVCVEASLWPLGGFLPSGFDPDSFVREHGAESLRQLLEGAPPLLSFCLRRWVPRSSRVGDRLRAAQELRQALGRVEDPVLSAEIARAAAQALGVPEDALRRQPVRPPRLASRVATPPTQTVDPLRLPIEERTLVEAMVLDRAAAQWVAAQGLWDCFQNGTLAQLARQVVQQWEEGSSLEEITRSLPAPLQAAIAQNRMGAGALSEVDALRVARDCAERVRSRLRKARLRALREQLRAAERDGDAALMARLREEIRQSSGPERAGN